MTEYEFANHIRLLGRTNKVYKSYRLGLPNSCSAAIQRNFLKTELVHRLHPVPSRNCTGKIRSHFEFQTMVIELTGMEINASLLDESAAAKWLIV
jgi:glycine dehydrogenase